MTAGGPGAGAAGRGAGRHGDGGAGAHWSAEPRERTAAGEAQAGSAIPRAKVNMIVARSKNGVIGRDGGIPWRLKDDMRFFRETTMGHTVVMGRKTFASLGRPLPGRRNVVVTRDLTFRADGVDVVHSPEEALALPRGPADGELFVIGGQQIYEALLPHADVIYLTEVDAVVAGDAYFPNLGGEWELTELIRHEADERNEYGFVIYVARRK